MEKISVMIVEGQQLVRDCWVHVLNDHPRFIVTGNFGDFAQALELARDRRPQVILVDTSLENPGDFTMAKKLRAVSPLSKVIGLSGHSLPSFAKKVFQTGATGYVTKNSTKEELYEAILRVHQGQKYLCDEVKAALANRFYNDLPTGNDIGSLTCKEIEVSQYIVRGFRSKEIASKMHISQRTVEVHRHNIFKKLKIRNLAGLVTLLSVTLDFPVLEE